MKLNKTQQNLEVRATVRAAQRALKEHFTGEGSKARTLTFLKQVSTTFIQWMAGLLVLSSWAVIAGLLIGPNHAEFLQAFHGWMVATPIDQVIAEGNDIVMSLGGKFLVVSLMMALALRLGDVTTPVVDQARQQFRAEAAGVPMAITKA